MNRAPEHVQAKRSSIVMTETSEYVGMTTRQIAEAKAAKEKPAKKKTFQKENKV